MRAIENEAAKGRGVEELAEEAEMVTDDRMLKTEMKELHEYRKDHYYHGSKKLKHTGSTR